MATATGPRICLVIPDAYEPSCVFGTFHGDGAMR
jgi:hypothetical protein